MAEKDGSGEISSDEVSTLIRELLTKSKKSISTAEANNLTEGFMLLVDKDKNGTVSFDEFASAMDHGLDFILQDPSIGRMDSADHTDKETKQLNTVTRKSEHLNAFGVDGFSLDQTIDRMKEFYIASLMDVETHLRLSIGHLLVFSSPICCTEEMVTCLTELQQNLAVS